MTRADHIRLPSRSSEKAKRRRDRSHQVTPESGTSATLRPRNKRRVSSRVTVSHASVGSKLIGQVLPFITQAEAIQSGLQESLVRAQPGFGSMPCDLSPENQAYLTVVHMRFNQCVVVAEQLAYALKQLVASRPVEKEAVTMSVARRRLKAP